MFLLQILQTAIGCIQLLITLRSKHSENYRLSGKLDSGLRFMKRELELIQEDIEEDKDLQVKLQELAYDIEDFIHGLCIPGPCGALMLSARGKDPRPQDIDHIEDFKKSIDRLQKRQQKRSESRQSRGCLVPGPSSTGSSHYTPEKDLVGFPEAKVGLLDLLLSADGQLRVISIVGCSGLGKTTLSRAVYEDSNIADGFNFISWVVASECKDAEDRLNKVLKEVDPTAVGGSISQFLQNRRYMVFIDDVQPQGVLWKDIEHAFPKNNWGSRIIVTTSVHSIARACSSGSYVHTMQYLGQAYSEKLFWRKVYGFDMEPSPDVVDGSKGIFVKCDGLPLALISAANYLGENALHLSNADCEDVGKALGDCLSGNESAFGKMRRALVQCYDSLPSTGYKSCLLYASIFPRGHQINSNSLVRRLLAEDWSPQTAV